MMPTYRPRITVKDDLAQPIEDAQFGVPMRYVMPAVSLEVSFDLHDHQAALQALDAAVGRVKAQIEETR